MTVHPTVASHHWKPQVSLIPTHTQITTNELINTCISLQAIYVWLICIMQLVNFEKNWFFLKKTWQSTDHARTQYQRLNLGTFIQKIKLCTLIKSITYSWEVYNRIKIKTTPFLWNQTSCCWSLGTYQWDMECFYHRIALCLTMSLSSLLGKKVINLKEKKNKSLFKVPLKSKEMLPNYILVICIFVIFSEIFSLLNL